MSSFGIDLGTTNSVIARLSGGLPVAVPVDGHVIVPSVVLYGAEGVRVGREARNLELQHPELTLRSVKRHMGSDRRFSVGGRSVTPEEASAEILRALKAGAEAATGEAVRDVVITVPAYFDEAQRRATLRAGELAGLNVLRLLNEPTAASLVYDRVGAEPGAGTEEPELVLIYDLGGGTYDVSVLEVVGEIREVRATTGNTRLGGDDFDEKLVQHFLDALKAQGVDPREDVRAMARLRRVAEEAKIGLSSSPVLAVHEEFITTQAGRAVHLDVTLTRREFEAMIEPLLASTIALARQALADAKVEAGALHRVCLVGGSTRIPRVRELLEEALGADVHEEVDVDLAVGLGASVQAGLLAGEPVGRILVDVTSHSLGVAVVGREDEFEANRFLPIIGRNTVLPATRTQEIYTMSDGQTGYLVQVFQGESDRVADNTPVGEFLSELAPRPAHSPVHVRFEYDLNGMVKVSVSQPGVGERAVREISVAGASAGAQAPAATPPGATTPLERKARRLLEALEGDARLRLQRAIDAYAGATGAAKEQAEEDLLDLLLQHEDE